MINFVKSRCVTGMILLYVQCVYVCVDISHSDKLNSFCLGMSPSLCHFLCVCHFYFISFLSFFFLVFCFAVAQVLNAFGIEFCDFYDELARMVEKTTAIRLVFIGRERKPSDVLKSLSTFSDAKS